MPSRLATVIELLHATGEIGLASQSAALPGYPYATSVAFATDERHRPVFLLSRLAEHTRNLLADPRAGLVVAHDKGEGEIARASLVGDVHPIEAEPALVRRYLRYHPAAERFAQFGDFQFYRFEPLRIRVVGGFAQAGWLDGQHLLDAPRIAADEEERLLEHAPPLPQADARLPGVDAYGIDLLVGAVRRRLTFGAGPLTAEAAPAAIARLLRGER